MPRSAFRILFLNVWARFTVVMSLMLLLIFGLDSRIAEYPPIGRILNPFDGLWLRGYSPLEKHTDREGSETLKFNGLKGKVTVHVDSDGIKHIFAENDHDLYLAQGYVVASDRLWQMEFLTRLAAGRLSEVFGDVTLETDKFFLKLGLATAAKESAEMMSQDPMTDSALKAYALGVNAYINSLTPKTLPFEYKLLGHLPEPWHPSKAALLLKFMAFNLSGYSVDLPLSRSRSRLSPEDFSDLFPLEQFSPEPVIPKGTRWPFQARVETPAAEITEYLPDLGKLDPIPSPEPGNGSNNWLVMGKKSSTGKPILSNDIHLGLTLPAIWYEIQLVSPTQNVYGVTLPGAPGVVLGFNSQLAWAVTNGQTDVMDWYELRFRDENLSEYLFDGDWRPVISNEVQIQVRGKAPVPVTLRRTHLGPIVYDRHETPFRPYIPRGLAMRWVALDGSNELKTFMLLNRSKSVKECREAIENYQNPAQNFLCADSSGDTGLWHMGRFPVRWKGQGRTIGDGTTSNWEWKGWIPKEEVPFAKNPARGFLSSANQNPVDESYPHYLGWNYEAPYRGMRINEILKGKENFSPSDLIKMQTDSTSLQAKASLAQLLTSLEGLTLDPLEQQAFEALKKWDQRFEASSPAATIFFVWLNTLELAVWENLFPDPMQYHYPSRPRLLKLLSEEPSSKWFDDPATSTVETFKERAQESFKNALKEIRKKTGSKDLEDWQWGEYRPSRFPHMGQIPGLGVEDIKVGGVDHAILANKGAHGPVWKLVVALGPQPKAWGVYPGGQSGDPTSPLYDNFISPWAKGEMKELNYLQKAGAQNKRLNQKVEFTP